jgi:hypothetical protein
VKLTLKKPIDWLKEPQYAGVVILDPDGWDRSNFEQSWNTAITEEVFQTRLAECTLSFRYNTFPKSYMAEGKNFID